MPQTRLTSVSDNDDLQRYDTICFRAPQRSDDQFYPVIGTSTEIARCYPFEPDRKTSSTEQGPSFILYVGDIVVFLGYQHIYPTSAFWNRAKNDPGIPAAIILLNGRLCWVHRTIFNSLSKCVIGRLKEECRA